MLLTMAEDDEDGDGQYGFDFWGVYFFGKSWLQYEFDSFLVLSHFSFFLSLSRAHNIVTISRHL